MHGHFVDLARGAGTTGGWTAGTWCTPTGATASRPTRTPPAAACRCTPTAAGTTTPATACTPCPARQRTVNDFCRPGGLSLKSLNLSVRRHSPSWLMLNEQISSDLTQRAGFLRWSRSTKYFLLTKCQVHSCIRGPLFIFPIAINISRVVQHTTFTAHIRLP